MRLATPLLLALTVLLAAPSARAEAHGDYSSVPLRPKDAELIEKSGEMEQLMVREGYVLTSGPEVDLVRRVGATIVPPHPVDPYMRFRFGVVRNPIPNAFALPDGQIYVHTGLLALLENEAQLASVLAHESMHVEGHHSILNARQARQKVGGMIALSVVFGQLGSLINIALEAAIIGYGRDLEEEADKRALPRILEAGYNPREMPRVFVLLEQDPEGDQLQRSPAWSDHPLGEAREAYTKQLLTGMEPEIAAAEAARGPLRMEADAYTDAVAWSARDSIQGYIDADRARSALVLAKKVTARWPDSADSQWLLGESYRALDARVTELPETDLTKKAKKSRLREYERKTREERAAMRRANPELAPVLERNATAAEAAYRKALELQPGHPGALRGLGYLLEDRGRLAEAGRCFADYVKGSPSAPDKPVVLQHLQSLTAALQGGHAP